MTDEGRQKLCERLRKNGFDMDAEEQAANEIERLAKIEKLQAKLLTASADALEKLACRVSELERKSPW